MGKRSHGNDHYKVVKEKIDLVEYLSEEGVDLVASGSAYKGSSPFNHDEHPSFTVYPDERRWVDYSGGEFKCGDCFDYVQLRDGVGKFEALQVLAEYAGVTISEEMRAKAEKKAAAEDAFRKIQDVMALACEHFSQNVGAEGPTEWIEEHWGFSADIIRRFKIGFDFDGTFKHLTNTLGVTEENALKTGLFRPVHNKHLAEGLQDYYEDFLRHRITIPHLVDGRIVYWAGRAISAIVPDSDKYYKLPRYNAKDRPYISRLVRNTIFNIDAIKADTTGCPVIVVEGYADAISADIAGYVAVAVGSTAISRANLHTLLPLVRKRGVIVVFDSEERKAGERGSIKTALILHRHGVPVKIARLPLPAGQSKMDLNDFWRTRPAEQFKKEFDQVLADAMSPIEFMIDSVPSDTPVDELAAKLSSAFSEIKQIDVLSQKKFADILKKKFGISRKEFDALVKVAELPKGLPDVDDYEEDDDDSTDATTDSDAPPVDEYEHLLDDFGNFHEPPPPPTKLPSSSSDEKTADAHGNAVFTVRGKVVESDKHYYCLEREAKEGTWTEQLTSFVLRPVSRIKHDGDEIIVASVLLSDGRTLPAARLKRSAFTSARGFKTALPSSDMWCTAKDEEVQGILACIAAKKEIPVLRGTSVLGYALTPDGPVWVTPDKIIGAAEPEDHTDLIFLPEGNPLAAKVRYEYADDADVLALATRVLPDLLRVNEPRTILPMLGWFFATPFKPRLMKTFGHFPILFCSGTKGTGKTSVIKEILWPLFGVPDADPFSATDTEFAVLRLFSSTNAGPVFLDEYRPNDMDYLRLKTLNRTLRRVYGGEDVIRGKADQTTVTYHLSAPVCVAGETRPETDEALRDRLTSVVPNANALTDHPEYKAAFSRLRAEPLWKLALPYVQFTLRQRLRDVLPAIITEADAVVDALPQREAVTTRCRDSLRTVAFGLRMLQKFASDLGVSLPEINLKDAMVSTVEDLMDSDRGPKSALDRFIETLSTLAMLGEHDGGFVDDVHFKVEKDRNGKPTGRINLYLPTCWDRYREHLRRIGEEVPPDKGLLPIKRLMKENCARDGYVVATTTEPVQMGSRRVRTVIIDLDLATDQGIDVGGFPYEMHAREGGKAGEKRIRKGDWA